MPKVTDLEAVKKLAKSFVYLDVRLDNEIFQSVYHPFTEYAFYPVKDDKNNTTRLANILEDKEALRIWRETLIDFIDEAPSLMSIYSRITKPYLFPFFKYAKEYLSKEDLSILWGKIWIRCERISGDQNFTQSEMLSIFQACEPSKLMEKGDYEKFLNLPDEIEVFRGVRDKDLTHAKALSWTTDIDMAKRFTRQDYSEGVVYSAKINRSHVYAAFYTRGENEIIVDPKFLKGISVIWSN